MLADQQIDALISRKYLVKNWIHQNFTRWFICL